MEQNIEKNTERTVAVKCKKSSFKDQETANKYILKLQATSKREKIPRRAYLCERCNTWHLTSKPDYKKIEKDSKTQIVESMDDKYEQVRKIAEELALELQEKEFEMEAMNKQLNKMYKEIYELNEIIKSYKNKDEQNQNRNRSSCKS